ncbi:MAG: hypothetical protein PHC61_12425 [Chitinivibrionales bacterium]|nr:hypothetical protein [Chitinivibrionales bacterium]
MARFTGKPNCLTLIIVGCLCAVLALSCSTSLQRVKLLGNTVSQGNYLKAIADIRNSKKLYGDKNRLLYYMDQGVLFHYAGLYDSSNAMLETSEQIIDDLYARSITNEAASLLTNDNIRPYRGRRYERVLLHEYMACNYLGKNQFDESLVETRKMQVIFDENAAKDKAESKKYEQDGMANYISSLVYDAQGENDNALISLFQSVKAYQKLGFNVPISLNDIAYYRLQQGDRAEDLKLLNLKPVEPANKIEVLNNKNGEVVFVGYAGKSPTIGETEFSGTYIIGGLIHGSYRDPSGNVAQVILPAPPLPESEIKKLENNEKTKAGTTFHIKFSLPAFVATPSQTAYFTVSIDGKPEVKSDLISDNDTYLRNDIADNFNVTLLRTAVRVVIRTLLAQKAKEKMETSSPLANVLLNVGTDIAADQLEKADTRVCFLFPKTVQLARLACAPGTHHLEICARTATGAILTKKSIDNVTISRGGQKQFVFYPSLM